jgi:[ribosomal protein S5]-alanine N-acetyltransferase
MTDVGRHAADGRLALRAIGAGDLDFLDRLCSDPEALGPFEWPGFGDVRARRRRWEQDGYAGPDSTVLAVVLADGTAAGIASWSTRNRSQPDRGVCYEIGLALLPEHRGHGLGTAAQRLLVDYLFRFTIVHRLEAITDSENIAEQKALERIGFEREGVMREVAFRDGAWRDAVIYALLRDGP